MTTHRLVSPVAVDDDCRTCVDPTRRAVVHKPKLLLRSIPSVAPTCHGTKGKGDGPAGKYLNPKPSDFAVSLKGKAMTGLQSRSRVEDRRSVSRP